MTVVEKAVRKRVSGSMVGAVLVSIVVLIMAGPQKRTISKDGIVLSSSFSGTQTPQLR